MLMEERVEYGRQIKNLELKALQAQINPHFLYNSLDLINCTAISRNVPEISRMVNALGQFYRLSLSSGREVITLAEASSPDGSKRTATLPFSTACMVLVS